MGMQNTYGIIIYEGVLNDVMTKFNSIQRLISKNMGSVQSHGINWCKERDNVI